VHNEERVSPKRSPKKENSPRKEVIDNEEKEENKEVQFKEVSI
jgi:hypothetical protein